MNYTLNTSNDETIENPSINTIEQKLMALQDGDFICLVRKEATEHFMQVLCMARNGALSDNKGLHLEYTEDDDQGVRSQYGLKDNVSRSEALTCLGQFLEGRNDYVALPRSTIELPDRTSHLRSTVMAALIVLAFLVCLLILFIF